MTHLSSDKYTAIELANITTYQAGVVQSMMSRQIKKFTDAALREYGITTMQWFIIGTIYDSGDSGIRISDLSKKIDTNVPYVTNSVNLLESKGMVVREGNDTDNRAKVIKISAAFAPKCKVIERSLRQKMRDGIYARVEPRELQVYLQVIHKLSSLQ